MKARKIGEGVYLIGAVDWDRRLFDSLIPLPQGTSYNAYFVQGSEKCALLDSVDPVKWHELEAQLAELPAPDYVICHHCEQDHSGSLVNVLSKYPEAVVVTNEKCKNELIDHLHISPDRFRVIADGESLSLGSKTLTFVFTPWVHWPETMCTWLEEDGILFTCDFFGSHLATSDLFVNEATVLPGAKRYYAEIFMPFATWVAKNLEKVAPYPAKLICPSHGPLYDRPAFIKDLYGEWASAAPKNLATLAFVTMHDSTRIMVDHLTGALVERGVAVERFDLAVADSGELASSLVEAATVIIATPTMLSGPHPLAAMAAFLVNALKPKARYAAIIGSFGWGGRTVERLTEMMPNFKGELLESLLVKGKPRTEDLVALDGLAEAIAARHIGLEKR
jgi:flavorubredoxin